MRKNSKIFIALVIMAIICILLMFACIYVNNSVGFALITISAIAFAICARFLQE